MTTLIETLTKVCTRCGIDKELKFFSKDSRSKLGVQQYCKHCVASYYLINREKILERVANFRVKNPDYYSKYYASRAVELRERSRQLRESKKLNEEAWLKQRQRNSDHAKRSNKLYPDRQKARLAVQVAVKSGKLRKPNNCFKCGRECKLEAHHESYQPEFWLVVKWFCRPCHAAHHRKYSDQPV